MAGMAKDPDLAEQAKTRRDLALRARRLAKGLGPSDARRLEAYAEELEMEAAELERQASVGGVVPLRPWRTVVQEQQQQQQSAPPETTSKDEKPKP